MEILSPKQAAVKCGVTEKTVRAWLKAKQIPGRRVGRRWLIPEDKLREFLAGPSVGAEGR